MVQTQVIPTLKIFLTHYKVGKHAPLKKDMLGLTNKIL